MNTIKVKDLKPGMKFTKPVYVDGENILVPENIPIKEKDLERIIRWKIDEVTTEGGIIKEEIISETPVEKNLRAVLDTGQNKELLKLYQKAVLSVQKIFEDLSKNKPTEKEKIEEVLDELYPSIRDNPGEMVGFTLRSIRGKQNTAESSINCAIISSVIGLNLKLPSHKAMNLALAALLHDTGMLRVSEEIKNKKGDLKQDELNQIKTHALHSYKIITKELKFPEEIGLAAVQHHERWDGKGYPQGITGKQIHLYARIISIADAFEAMVSERPYRNSMIGYAAMRQILNDNSRRFDSDILKVFIKSMGIYPFGSIVLLNDSSIGKVVNINQETPLRPEILLLVNSDGKQCKEEKRIDLLKEKNLFIAKAIHPKEIQEKLGD